MKITRLSLVAAVLFAGTAASAEITAQDVIADYQAQGFTRIEVRTGLTQIKVEAFKGTQKVEVVLDKATGTVLKRETGTAGVFENTDPGVSVRERNRDFVKADSDDSDESTDDDGDDRGSDDDDDSSDDNGGDRGSDDDDDSSDDNGGDRGSDDDSSDDNGGDRGSDDDDDSSDDNGSDDDDDSGSDDDNGGDSGSDDDDNSGSGSDDD